MARGFVCRVLRCTPILSSAPAGRLGGFEVALSSEGLPADIHTEQRMGIRARRWWRVLAPARRPGWLDVGGRWPPVLCVLVVLPLAIGLRVLFAYWAPSVRVGMLTEVLLLTFVMARSRAVRWHDLFSLTAALCLANFLFLVGPARWIWPDYGSSTLSSLRVLGHPALIAASCGQVVLALLVLAGLDPQLRTQIRGFVTPVGRGFVLRAAGVTVLLVCALWNGRHLVNGDTLVRVKVEVFTIDVGCPTVPGSEPSITPNTPTSPALTSIPSTPPAGSRKC
jgi:hypothetical protein